MTREFQIVAAHSGELLIGLWNTVTLSVCALALALVLGPGLTILLMSRLAVIRKTAEFFRDLMRCAPFLLLAYLIYYGLPSLGLRLDNWSAGLVALVIYNAAYVGELLRGSWANLPREQIEAGLACGFHGLSLFRRVILPPIALSAIPMLGNQSIQIIKDTAF